MNKLTAAALPATAVIPQMRANLITNGSLLATVPDASSTLGLLAVGLPLLALRRRPLKRA